MLFEDPVLPALEIHQVVTGVGAVKGIPVNLADRAVIGADLGLEVVGKAGLGDALQDLLAIPIVGGFVVEDEHHAGKSEQRSGPQILQVWDAVHDNFQRNGDLLFNFFGGAAGPLRDDLDVVVGDVGIGFDGEIMERDGAPDQQQESGQRDQETVIEGVIDQGANHRATRYCSTVFCKTRALETTRSPGLSPEIISCRLGGAIRPPTTSTRRKLLLAAGTYTQSRSCR